MSQISLFSVSISSELPDDKRETLLLVLRTLADVQEPTYRDFGQTWDTFVAIVQDVGSVAGTATVLMKLANEINTWKRTMQQRGIEPKVQLQRPNQNSLNLANATDEEVLTWLLQQTPK